MGSNRRFDGQENRRFEGWGRLFSDSNEQSEGSKNCSFAFTKNQAKRYIKVASYPSLARQALLKAKEKVGHGGWEGLFGGANPQSEGSKNCGFAFNKRQANSYMKVASYPALARQALLEDQGERFNLDRTYAVLAGRCPCVGIPSVADRATGLLWPLAGSRCGRGAWGLPGRRLPSVFEGAGLG